MDYFDILLARKLANEGDITTESLSVTTNGIYTAPSGKAYTPVTVEVAPPEDSYQLKSITTPTSLATFEASEMPMPSLKVSVEAKQDLHGYDKPWVGGAGKNKAEINITDAALTEITDSDGNKIGFKYNSTTAQSYVITIKVGEVSIKSGKTYTLSGSPSGFGNDSYRLDVRSGNTVYNNWNETNNATITASEDITLSIYVRIAANYAMSQSLIFRPQIEEGSVATTFAPYSNICPISGWSEVNVSDVDDVDNPTVTQTTTIPLGQTVYGAEVDVVNGILKITDGYIASYNGETLPSTWISSMDEYAEGTTPTTGAEVCYELATPTTLTTQPTPIKSLEGTNNLSVDCGEVIEGEYFKALGGDDNA